MTGHLSKDSTGHVQSQRLDGHPFLKGVSSPVNRPDTVSFTAEYRRRIERAVLDAYARPPRPEPSALARPAERIAP